MAKGTVNKVILVGNMTADPEVRRTPSGHTVANIRFATNEKFKDREGALQESGHILRAIQPSIRDRGDSRRVRDIA